MESAGYYDHRPFQEVGGTKGFRFHQRTSQVGGLSRECEREESRKDVFVFAENHFIGVLVSIRAVPDDFVKLGDVETIIVIISPKTEATAPPAVPHGQLRKLNLLVSTLTEN